MVNLFAFRATRPAALVAATDPIGPENDEWLERAVAGADLAIAAWGNHGRLLGQADKIAYQFRGRLHALSVTKASMPGHPLYIPRNTQPTLFAL